MQYYPKRPESHVIGDEAVRIFTSACPRQWIISPIQHDYGLDLRIEPTQEENVTGEEFYVQLKGRGEIDEPSGEVMKVPISQSTINYWLGKIPPVLIVLVDISQKRFWFDWLEYAYPYYPNYRSEKENVNLLLQRNNTKDSLTKYIPEYLSDYFSRVRADISKLFESTQVTRMLYHVTQLFQLCARMVNYLQRDTKDLSDEEMTEQWQFFAQEFGWHDMMVRIPWHLYANRFYTRSQNIVFALESRFKSYEEIRGQFLKERDTTKIPPEQNTIAIIPQGQFPSNVHWEFKSFYLDYRGMIENLLPTMDILQDIEEMLFQILLIGRVQFQENG